VFIVFILGTLNTVQMRTIQSVAQLGVHFFFPLVFCLSVFLFLFCVILIFFFNTPFAVDHFKKRLFFPSRDFVFFSTFFRAIWHVA